MAAFAVHDPDAVLDYTFDWSAWLYDGESIAQSEWSGPDGVTLDSTALDTIATVRVTVTDESLSGQVIELINHIVSTDGQEDDRTLKLLVADK